MTKPLPEVTERKAATKATVTALESKLARLEASIRTHQATIAKLRGDVALWRERALELEGMVRDEEGDDDEITWGKWEELS